VIADRVVARVRTPRPLRLRRAHVRVIDPTAKTVHGHTPALDGLRPGRAGERATRSRGAHHLPLTARLVNVTSWFVRNDASSGDTAMVGRTTATVAAPTAAEQQHARVVQNVAYV
jgi:hypothetical protein